MMASSRFKAEGEKEFLVLLVQFKDIPFKVENPKEAFDQMLSDGFLDEMRRLMARPDYDPESPAMRAVGYRQIWD